MGPSARRSRLMHSGPYKLEKISRVDETMTLIIEDEIKRVPRRADGFERARHGDYGKQQKRRREAAGGARKAGQPAPLVAALGGELLGMLPRHDGEVAADPAPIPDDPATVAEHIKSLCCFLDSDQVGICDAKTWT